MVFLYFPYTYLCGCIRFVWRHWRGTWQGMQTARWRSQTHPIPLCVCCWMLVDQQQCQLRVGMGWCEQTLMCNTITRQSDQPSLRCCSEGVSMSVHAVRGCGESVKGGKTHFGWHAQYSIKHIPWKCGELSPGSSRSPEMSGWCKKGSW